MFAKDRVERNRVKAILEKKYGELAVQTGNKVTYIGLDIERVREDDGKETFLLGQEAFIESAALKHGVSVIAKSPNDETFLQEDESSPATDIRDFRSLVMSVRYVTSLTRTDLLFLPTYLASKQAAPTESHKAKALRLLAYLLYTKKEVVRVRALGPDPEIRVHADASQHLYPGGLGHGGIALFIGLAMAALFCKSKKHSVQTDSSTDSEIVCMTTATLVGDFFRCFLDLLGFHPSVVLYLQDNTSAICLMQDGTDEHAKKRKFLVNRINCITQYLNNSDNRASMKHLGSRHIPADILSKPLTGVLRDHCAAKLLGRVHDMADMDAMTEAAHVAALAVKRVKEAEHLARCNAVKSSKRLSV